MEKNKPHHSRDEIKRLIGEGKASVTMTAIRDGFALGMDRDCILEMACSLTSEDFYKSMTSNSDHRSWQDVYHPTTPEGLVIYLKLTITDGVLILSFKEK